LDGWEINSGTVTEKSVLPMRSFVSTPMRRGRLFLAGDAAHIVPPTGAKGLNLAVADVTLLATALARLLQEKQTDLVDSYSDRALARVWRCTHFSWFMTSMLHRSGDDFDAELQLSQLRRVSSASLALRGPWRPRSPRGRDYSPRSDRCQVCKPIRSRRPDADHSAGPEQ